MASVDQPAVLAAVRAFIVENFLFGVDDENLTETSSFLENGIVDSTGILELITFVETTYSITVDDSEMVPENLDEAFFNSDMVVFGGTAIVPGIHDNLSSLLSRAKKNGGLTVVNTVYDFRNEKLGSGRPWPLGETEETYSHTDILITDKEEALRLSGRHTMEAALDFFIEKNTRTAIITNGAEGIHVFSDGSVFEAKGKSVFPVSERVRSELRMGHAGDTTGCGDNFAGGLIGSVVNQLRSGRTHFDLQEAISWATVSGGFACFYLGGTYFEEKPGEKLAKMMPYYTSYKRQISGE